MHIKRHQARCASDIFNTWRASRANIPTETVAGKTTYACVICGTASHNRANIVTHLGNHGLLILKRFNLDIIFSHQDSKAETLPCLTNPTCSFPIEKLD